MTKKICKFAAKSVLCLGEGLEEKGVYDPFKARRLVDIAAVIAILILAGISWICVYVNPDILN